jgi:hypothetical protein
MMTTSRKCRKKTFWFNHSFTVLWFPIWAKLGRTTGATSCNRTQFCENEVNWKSGRSEPSML